jgi:subtilisin family serine protease
VSHRPRRSTLTPFASGLTAVIAVCGVVGSVGVFGSTPAFAAASGVSAAAGNPVRAQEWWLDSLNVAQAWRTTRGAGVTVAVLGTGVAVRHPDLAGGVATGPDYSGSGRTPDGPFWGIDGTQVASVIAGRGHGPGHQSGIVGVAPAARILSVRVNLEFNDPLNSDQAVTRRLPGAIADGITYAVDHGARVIDLPLDPGTFGPAGGGDPAAAGGSRAEQAAVAYALRKSVVLVAPAGDDGDGPGLVNYPAAYTGVIAVGAVSRSSSLAPFSSRRSYVALTAPGVNLTAATPPAGYAAVSSTSAASGIVAGVAALLLSRFPHLTVAQVTRALTTSTVTPGGTAAADNAAGPGTGHGTVDAARAVSVAALFTAAGAATPTSAPTPTPSRPQPSAGRVGAAAHRADVSALAGSLVRAVVAGLGVLIVLVIVLILVMRSRRKRTGSGPYESGRSGIGRSGSGRSGSGRSDLAGAQNPGRNQRTQGTQEPRGAREPQGTRGQHGRRRAGRAPAPSQEPTGLSTTVRRPQLAPPGALGGPGAPLTPGVPGAPGGLGVPLTPGAPGGPAATGWPAPGGWQGGGLGEIAHPPGQPARPAIAPVARTANPVRGGRSTADASPPSPPWAPAPEPDQTSGPFPVAAGGSFRPAPGSGLRVPRDVPRPPTFTARPPGPGTPAVPRDFHPTVARPGFDGPATIPDFAALDQVTGPAASAPMAGPAASAPLAGPAASAPIAGPAASGPIASPAAPGQFSGTTANPAAARPGDGPDVTEKALGPDVMEAATDPDITRIAGRPRPAGPVYGPDFPTRQGVDFAAAPVATGYPGPARPAEDAATVYPGDAAPYRGDPASYRGEAGPVPADGWPPAEPPAAGSGSVADPNSIWDLAATDVFPVAPSQPPDDEAPGAS